MALMRWHPLREIDALQREMNQLFDTLTPSTSSGNGESRLSFMPAAETHETPEAVHLKLELPGINAGDLDIQVTRNSVSIAGERKSEHTTESNGVTRSEFRYGRFQRVIPVASQIESDAVEANYKDGVLELTLPKAETEKSKSVKVKVD